MAISNSSAGRCGILDSKHWSGRFSTCNLANFLLLLAPKGGRFVSCAAKATAVKVAGAPASQNLKELLESAELKAFLCISPALLLLLPWAKTYMSAKLNSTR
ncbi:unnamed protein product [Natator depressus]